MRKKKILHVITGLNVGGAERSLHNLLSSSFKKYFDNYVLSLGDEGYYGDLLKKEGIPISCLRMNSSFYSLINILKLRSVLLLYNPDIVQGWLYHGNLAATISRFVMKMKPRVSWNIRNSLESIEGFSRNARLGIFLGGMLSRSTDLIIYNSHRAKNQHESRGFSANCSEVIENGFDTDIWKRDESSRRLIRNSLGVSDAEVIIGFVGRNDPQKDLNTFFVTARKILSLYANIKIVMVGRDLHLAMPEDMPAGKISFLGSRSDVPFILSAFDLFCLSSQSEGFPNVIGEAMACSIPCVATDVGDARSIIGDTGWIAQPKNSTDLAEKIIEALSLSAGERYFRGTLARQRIEKFYSLNNAIDRYRSLYDRICLR